MKLSLLLLLIAATAPVGLNAAVVYLNDARSVYATASQQGNTPQSNANDSESKTPIPLFSAFNEIASAGVPSIGATAFQQSVLGADHIGYYGSVTTAGAIAGGADWAVSSATSNFAVTFSVDTLSTFSLSGFKWANFLGDIHLSSPAGSLIAWDASSRDPNSRSFTGLLQPGTVYTLAADITWSLGLSREFGKSSDSFGSHMSFDMRVQAVPDAGIGIALMAVSLTAAFGLNSGRRFRAK
jgi:hypothetical protein